MLGLLIILLKPDQISANASKDLHHDPEVIFNWLNERQKQICSLHASCSGDHDAGFYDLYRRCCGHCTCDSMCHIYGSCCLDAYSNLEEAQKWTKLSRHGCIRSQYLPSNESYFSGSRFDWMVTKCSDETNDLTLRESCENPDDEATLESLVPVTSFTTGLSYRNIFCAFCNGLDDTDLITAWGLQIMNKQYLQLPDDNIISKIKEAKGNIFFVPPDFVTTTNCLWPPYSVSKCNQTGQWPRYDEKLEIGCSSFVDPFNQTYKNFFCYLCNTDSDIDLLSSVINGTCPNYEFPPFTDVSPPFFALLDIDEIKAEQNLNEFVCDNSQFKDEKKMKCRDIKCGSPASLEAGKCDIYDIVVTERYCLALVLKIKSVSGLGFPVDKLRNSSFESDLMALITKKADYSGRALSEAWAYLHQTNNHYSDYFLLYMKFVFYENELREMQRHLILSLHQQNASFSSQFSTVLYLEIVSQNAAFGHDSLNILNPFNITQIDMIFHSKYDNSSFCHESNTTFFKKLSVCPYIELSLHELPHTIVNGYLCINSSTSDSQMITFSSWEYEVYGDVIHMCLQDYLRIYSALPETSLNLDQSRKDSETKVRPKEIVSFCCVCCSITCVCVTIVVYIKFSSKQSQPMINNVVLCICLLLAQAMYQFGAGQRSLTYGACSVIGALCHFLWLCVMFSMNACSLQMFIIFRTISKLSPLFSWNHTLKVILYVVGCSCLFVVVNLAVSLGTSKGLDSGYGGRVCFVSSYVMHLVTFLVPCATTLSINIVLFGFTVVSIQHISRHSAKLLKRERNLFLAYARLSSLTGITWILGFVQLLFKNEILEYLFIVLNAAQGVFIMVAFVLNKRIFAQCCVTNNTNTEQTDT